MLTSDELLRNVVTNPLQDFARELGIDDYEWRGFDRAFTNYVNLVDRDDYTHREACDALKIGGERWENACRELYRAVLAQPELYW